MKDRPTSNLAWWIDYEAKKQKERRGRLHERAIIVLSFLFLLILLAGLYANQAKANPWCGPMNGPGGNFWPFIQSCQLNIPGTGGMVREPGLAGPQNVPYRNLPATPFYPFSVPPVP